jgi:hypothetical protein
MRNHRVIALASVSFFASLSAGALAAPFQYPKCKAPKVKAPENGVAVYFDESCQTGYVLPPVAGEASVAAIAQNTNLNFCPAVRQVGAVSESTVSSARIIADKVEAMIKDFDPLEKEIVELRLQATSLGAIRDAAKERKEAAVKRKEELIEDVGKANRTLTECKATAADPTKDCATEDASVKEAKDALRKHIANVSSPAENAYEDAQLEFKKVQNRITDRNTSYSESIEPILALQDRIFELNNKVFDLYKQYTPLEGAVGQIVYSVPWDKLVRDYQAFNPGVTLTKIPIKDATFTASVRLGKTADVSLPGVLWSRIPGAQAAGPAQPPSGEAVIGPNPTVPSGRDISDVAIGFGTSISGQIAFSLSGACEYFPNGGDPNKTDINAKDFAAHLVGNVVYTYEVAARRGYTAHYNLSNFVSRIEKNTKKGGWFSTKNIHSVIEDNNSSDWLKIEFKGDSSEFQYTDQEQKDLARDVKTSLIDRAMRNLGSINGLNSTPPPLPPEPGPSGVGVAAANLRRGCWWNYWCLAASYTLGTLDSIFGSKSSVSNFKKSNNVWVTDEVSGIQILDRHSGLTFLPVSELK